jgi:uncharacterized DUF497 family protein
MRLEWDSAKNDENLEKHGVSFDEASKLLSSTADCMEVFDHAHSDEEDRFVAIGPIARGIIVVVFTERDEGTIRIISARAATRGERRRYEAWKVRAID